LAFSNDVEPLVRRRIDYAFRVFCAVYGFTPSTDGPTLKYAGGYRLRPQSSPAPAPSWFGSFPCFHGLGKNGRPDWLAEIFEWLSAAHEFSIEKVDSVGRIPYVETLHGRYGLDPLVPYAAIAMHELDEEIGGTGPLSPWPGACVFATTHDLDFLPASLLSVAHRFVKDLGLALFLRSPLSIKRDTARRLLEREREHGIRSSWYVIARRGHRRDATYRLRDRKVCELLAQVAEVGVHGSYTSLETKGRLAGEYRTLDEAGYSAVGGRQHWLRYRNTESLMEEVCLAGGRYDCTFGYATRPGFRNGACFPFPPYSFVTESAFPVLELPLMIMDVTLNGDALAICRELFSQAREFGWGGTSILWHDTTFGTEVGEIYWQIKEANDLWMPACELVETIWPRYTTAGLLP